MAKGQGRSDAGDTRNVRFGAGRSVEGREEGGFTLVWRRSRVARRWQRARGEALPRPGQCLAKRRSRAGQEPVEGRGWREEEEREEGGGERSGEGAERELKKMRCSWLKENIKQSAAWRLKPSNGSLPSSLETESVRNELTWDTGEGAK